MKDIKNTAIKDVPPKYISGDVITRAGEKWTIIKSKIQKWHINYFAKDKNGFEAWIGQLDDN